MLYFKVYDNYDVSRSTSRSLKKNIKYAARFSYRNSSNCKTTTAAEATTIMIKITTLIRTSWQKKYQDGEKKLLSNKSNQKQQEHLGLTLLQLLVNQSLVL